MNRSVWIVLGRVLRRCAAALESRVETPEPPPLDPEEQLRRSREQHRKAMRAARTPWYQRRPGQVTIPESLKYYEAVHGTRATLDMLRKVSKKLDE